MMKNKVTNVYKTRTYFIIITLTYINTYRKKTMCTLIIMPIIVMRHLVCRIHIYLLRLNFIYFFQSSSTQATILPSAPGNTLSSDEI